MANVKVSALHKHFGPVHAVRGVDLDIPDGEFTVLVGPSGCGKSTLLRTIAGLEEVDDGVIEIGGEVVNDMRPRDRDVAMVFQDYALYPHMTVFGNISLSLRARRMAKTEIEERVRRVADMLGIVALLERYPRQLSGGQRQRVAIGRAIVRNPRVFLFDEPLSNLDAQLRDEMRGEIKRLHQEIATTMIYVTHDQVEAMTLADRIVLLRDGVIEQQGAPLDLFEQPATLFVAGFLGSPRMNFLKGRLEARTRGRGREARRCRTCIGAATGAGRSPRTAPRSSSASGPSMSGAPAPDRLPTDMRASRRRSSSSSRPGRAATRPSGSPSSR